MATMTISLPDSMKTWIDDLVRQGDYASASDYMRDIVRKDKAERGPIKPLTIEELRQMLEEAEQSGISDKSLEEIFEEAMQVVAKRQGRVA